MTDYEAAFWKLKNNWDASVRHYEERIDKLEAALRQIKELHHGPEDENVSVVDSIFMRDDRTYKIVCDTLEGKDD